jgi:hypothetical protein
VIKGKHVRFGLRRRSTIAAGVASLVVLLMLLSITTCDLFGPSETYTLVKVNGQPLPTVYELGNVVDGSTLEGSMLRGKLEFLGNRLYRMTYLHRIFVHEGMRVIQDTTWTWKWEGPYYWTDSTLVLYLCTSGCSGRVTSTLRIQENRSVLHGAELVPVGMGVEWVQR